MFFGGLFSDTLVAYHLVGVDGDHYMMRLGTTVKSY